MAVIGLDLGGTKLAGAIFDDDGTVVHRATVPLDHRRGKDVGQLIQQHTADLLNTAGNDELYVSAIGIGVPGISYSNTGRVWAPNIPGWGDYPLRDDVLAIVGNDTMPVAIDSDRACAILGESWTGAAKGCTNAIFLAVGTGIGAGILVDGAVLRGAHDIAGAVGWLALDRPFQKKYVDCGCFEQQASGEGIAKTAREVLVRDTTYTGLLRSKNPEAITAEDVFSAFASHDPLAIKVFDQCVELWGMTVANLVSIFNPEKIIFGGGVFGPAAQFLPAIYEEAKKWAQPISITQVKLEASRLGSDAVLYGAGHVAMRSVKK